MGLQGNCYQCHQNLGGYRFCPHCGTEQKCFACDTPFQIEGKFCSECGVEKGKTGAEQAVSASVEQPKVRLEQQVSQVPEQAMPNSEPIRSAVESGSGPKREVSQQQEPASVQQVNKVTPVNNQGQTSDQAKSRRQQVAASTPKKKQKFPLFVVIAVLVAAAVAVYFFYFNHGTGAQTPEEAVKGFVEALDEREAEKIAPYIMPAVRDEVLDDIHLNEIPTGAEIKLMRFGDIEYKRDTMAEVEARLAFRLDGEEETETLLFELIQMKNKWFIVEVY